MNIPLSFHSTINLSPLLPQYSPAPLHINLSLLHSLLHPSHFNTPTYSSTFPLYHNPPLHHHLFRAVLASLDSLHPGALPLAAARLEHKAAGIKPGRAATNGRPRIVMYILAASIPAPRVTNAFLFFPSLAQANATRKNKRPAIFFFLKGIYFSFWIIFIDILKANCAFLKRVSPM